VNIFALNLLLAIGWAAVIGDFSEMSLIFGFVIGFVALWVAKPLFGDTHYFVRFHRSIHLALFFLWELWVSCVRVAWDVITPRLYARPGVIAVPLDATTDLEITMTANLISLTPGTLSLDVSEDRKTLYVHAMYISEVDALKRELKDGMERRVTEAFRS
jgi:multicomponent Na+:H+ antiporter subunit E